MVHLPLPLAHVTGWICAAPTETAWPQRSCQGPAPGCWPRLHTEVYETGACCQQGSDEWNGNFQNNFWKPEVSIQSLSGGPCIRLWLCDPRRRPRKNSFLPWQLGGPPEHVKAACVQKTMLRWDATFIALVVSMGGTFGNVWRHFSSHHWGRCCWHPRREARDVAIQPTTHRTPHSKDVSSANVGSAHVENV